MKKIIEVNNNKYEVEIGSFNDIVEATRLKDGMRCELHSIPTFGGYNYFLGRMSVDEPNDGDWIPFKGLFEDSCDWDIISKLEV